MIKAIYDLDMTPMRTLPIIINVSQYDDLGRTLVFNLFSSSGKWTAPTSAAVTFEGGKPDGKFFAYNCAYSNGTVTVTIQQQMTAVAGKVRCKIKVKSGDKVVESAPIIMVVDAAAVPDGSDMSKSDINDAIANATQKIVDQVKDNIPSDYAQLSTDVSSLKSDFGNVSEHIGIITGLGIVSEIKNVIDFRNTEISESPDALVRLRGNRIDAYGKIYNIFTPSFTIVSGKTYAVAIVSATGNPIRGRSIYLNGSNNELIYGISYFIGAESKKTSLDVKTFKATKTEKVHFRIYQDKTESIIWACQVYVYIVEINDIKNPPDIRMFQVPATEHVAPEILGETRQRKCIFFDTFVRNHEDNSEVLDNKNIIRGYGNNGNVFVWRNGSEFASIQNYATIDSQGANIMHDELHFSKVEKDTPILANANVIDDYFAEVPIIPSKNGKIGVCLKYINEYDYYYITIDINEYILTITALHKYNALTIPVKSVTYPLNSTRSLLTDNDFCVLAFLVSNNNVFMYIDRCPIYDVHFVLEHISLKTGGVGLMAYKKEETIYLCFAVYVFRDFGFFTTKTSIDRGRKKIDTYIYPNDDNYTIVDSSLSPYAEEHYLISDDVTDNNNAHCETNYSDLTYASPNRHVIVEFDKYFPEDFLIDDLDEIIFQFHGRNNRGGTAIFSPPISINVKGKNIKLHVMGSPNRWLSTNTAHSEYINIGTINVGKWMHFKLEIDEGCSKFFFPKVSVWVDGKYRGCLKNPNSYCEDYASQFQYGIYKWDWANESKKPSGSEKKMYVTDNVEVKM